MANQAVIEAIRKMGGQVQAATTLNVTQPAISRWIKNQLPVERCAAVEMYSGISKAKLRPDIFGKTKQDKSR